MKSYAVTDKGVCRRRNQDSVFGTCEPVGMLDNLFAVADGMGGHLGGDYASSQSILKLEELMRNSSEPAVSKRFEEAYDAINKEIYHIGHTEAEYFRMGTTLVAATLNSDRLLTVANVGDSRLYLYDRKGGLRQITKDHSYVEELVRKGEITRDSELYLRSKNIITRAIGAAENVKTDIFQIEIESGSQFLLCSDGLTNMVEDDRIAQVLAEETGPKEKTLKLVQMANEAGGEDNISVIVVETE